jgi:phenylacetate-coenzyme A ligase PaaK-like adenylate-forming protein
MPETRALLGEVWGVPILNGYGMSEGMFTGACAHGVHLPDDLCLVEIVDGDGRPAPPGHVGERILVTNLYNPTLPLIRFEVTDQVGIAPGACPCGSVLRLIGDPQGRIDDTFPYPDGTIVHPHVFRDVLGQHPTLVEYQVRQTLRGADIAVVTEGPTDETALVGRVVAALRRVGLAEPVVTVDLVAGIDRLSSGKLKRFVPL